MDDFSILSVNVGNVDEHGFFCVKNKKHPGYIAKMNWLKRRFEEGMRIKILNTNGGKQAGFLEYVPGESTWRTIHAPDYMVIHCIWVDSKKFGIKGMASALIAECIEDAREQGKVGVSVVTSDGTWMVGKDVFLKNGFEQVDTYKNFQLLAKKVREGSTPSFPQNWEERLDRFAGLQLIYTKQCPYIGKAIAELPPVADQYGIPLHLVEINDAAEARKMMPSPYGVFNLVYNGRLLADHPISATRFRNILVKEITSV